MNKLFMSMCLCLLACTEVFAQTAPSATARVSGIAVGAEMSTFNPDWGCSNNSPFSCWDHQLLGVTAFADADRLIGRVGIEAEGRWLHFHNWGTTKNKLVESNYLVGPRVHLFETRHYVLAAKVLFGASSVTVPIEPGTGTYFSYAIGPTLEYAVTRNFRVRADYEYQNWPGFTGRNGNNGLTPNGLSFGVRYQLPGFRGIANR